MSTVRVPEGTVLVIRGFHTRRLYDDKGDPPDSLAGPFNEALVGATIRCMELNNRPGRLVQIVGYRSDISEQSKCSALD